ncbi:MAG: DUF4358 domain-containing protein [Oscillospiraceae bacterium]|nr:DUF4358 domain-containing protein [Oscillospiraceae bacterium]
MKKWIALGMAVLLLLLSACGGEAVTPPTPSQTTDPSTEKKFSADALAVAIIADSGRNAAALQFVNDSYDSDALITYVERYYGLASEAWGECSIYRHEAEAYEVSVFWLTEQADPESVYQSLESYRHARQGDFFGYNPEQEAVVEQARVAVTDNGWAAVLICPDAARAEEYLCALLDGTVLLEEPEADVPSVPSLEDLPSYWEPYVDPEIDDMSLWDNTAMVAAVKAGDDSGLSKKDKKLYRKVTQVLETEIREDMTALEKELAIYTWLTANASYDLRHYDIPNAAPRESYEPHGAILGGKAVCLGFATAFQLFMDVLDIECITVVGAAFNSREDHAWNMVRLDGEWYCTDATWDEGAYGFGFFNRSSDYFAMTGHQWDYEAYPIAVAEEDGKLGTPDRPISYS